MTFKIQLEIPQKTTRPPRWRSPPSTGPAARDSPFAAERRGPSGRERQPRPRFGLRASVAGAGPGSTKWTAPSEARAAEQANRKSALVDEARDHSQARPENPRRHEVGDRRGAPRRQSGRRSARRGAAEGWRGARAPPGAALRPRERCPESVKRHPGFARQGDIHLFAPVSCHRHGPGRRIVPVFEHGHARIAGSTDTAIQSLLPPSPGRN